MTCKYISSQDYAERWKIHTVHEYGFKPYRLPHTFVVQIKQELANAYLAGYEDGESYFNLNNIRKLITGIFNFNLTWRTK